LQKKTRSLLDELDNLLIHRDKENLIESRATHIIQGAINLINTIRESYDAETADEMERRFINSIRGQDPAKFTRCLKKVTNENKRNNQ
jgi:hypothetical protein